MSLRVSPVPLIVSLAIGIFACTPKTGSLLAPAARTVPVGASFKLHAIAGHHLNAQAPHSCGVGGIVSSIDASGMECKFTQTGTAEVRVGVCDDAVSFCKFQTHEVQITKD